MAKKFVLVCIMCASLVVSESFFFAAPKTYAVKNIDFVVVIDPGHGGIDPGVTGTVTNVKESDLNLWLSKDLAECFTAAGIATVLTRTQDVGLYVTTDDGFKLRDLSRRVAICKEVNGDVFISVHMNEYKDSSRRGAQVFYRAGSSESKNLSLSVQDQLNGLEEASRICSPLAGDYYVLNNSDCPAIIVECGFLSNAEDEALLCTKEYRQSVAYAIYAGVINFIEE